MHTNCVTSALVSAATAPPAAAAVVDADSGAGELPFGMAAGEASTILEDRGAGCCSSMTLQGSFISTGEYESDSVATIDCATSC